MKDKSSTRVTIPTSNDNSSEPCYLVSYTPGKKTGDFDLPFGGKINIPAGIFGKRDTFICHVASPAERVRFFPILAENEHVTSEIFTLTSPVIPLKKNVLVQIPFHSINPESSELNVRGRWEGEEDWVNVGFLVKEPAKPFNPPMVELDLDRLGTFVVTYLPKRELFKVSVQGCLYNPRISRYITVRFPKKATDVELHCALQITPIPRAKLDLAAEQYPLQCSDIIYASEFIDITPDVQRNFRRAATIKLPLPAELMEHPEEGDHDHGPVMTDMTDVCVLAREDGEWHLIESAYKFTRTTISFDVKHLGRFCVAKSKPDRLKRLKDAMPFLEGRLDKKIGVPLVYLSRKEKSWTLSIDCVPRDSVDPRNEHWHANGYRGLERASVAKADPVVRWIRRQPPPKEHKPKEPEQELWDGIKWKVEITGDIKVSDLDKEASDVGMDLMYLENLPENNRKYVIEPKTNDEKGLLAMVSIRADTDHIANSRPIVYKIEIDSEAVAEYFTPEFVPEPVAEPEPAVLHIPELNNVPVIGPSEPKVAKFKPLPPDVMDRLTKSIRKPIIVERESRVLSGKSLLTLARVIPEGLTLAVHLDLPDSTITGIGFDALASGLGMSDVTYKILLFWKRRQKDRRDVAVGCLTDALRDMGHPGVASKIMEYHDCNKELTAAIFEGVA